MAIVMITIIFLVLTMMVEIAVHLMQIIGITFVKYVNVFSLIQVVRMNGPRKNARNAMRKNARKTRNVKRNVKTLAIFARMAELLPAR